MKTLCLFLCLVLCSVLTACKSHGVDTGVVARAYTPSIGNATMPPALVAFDGDTFVAWGKAAVVAELYLKFTGADLVPPLSAGSETVIVRTQSTGFKWDGVPGTTIFPPQAAMAFKPGQAEMWGVTFQEDAPPIEEPPAP